MTIIKSAPATNQDTPNNAAVHRPTQSQYSTNLDLALQLAKRGWFVFPCREKPGEPYTDKQGEVITPKKKAPYWHKNDLPDGKDNASVNDAQIRTWWKRWPAALVGVYCLQSAIFALDLDVKDGKDGLGGFQTLISLHAGEEEFHYGPAQTTLNGGKHIIFRDPVNIYVPNTTDALGPGIDLRSNGYFCTGGPYRWEPNHGPDTALTEAPAWLLGLIEALSKPKPLSTHLPPVAPCPGNDKVSWAQGMLDLLAPHRCSDYHYWLKVGMALTELGETGFSLWDNWSRKCPEKYDAGACAKHWKSFKPGKGISLGSLYYMFQEDNPSMTIPAITITRNGNGHHRQEVQAPEDAPWPEDFLEAPAATPEPAPTDNPIPYTKDDFFVPDLPKAARLPENLLAKGLTQYGQWLTDYVNYAKKAAPMSAPEFHQVLGLTMLATGIARRVKIKVSFDEFYTNLYSLIVGSSGDKKSTATRLAAKTLALAKLSPLTLPGYMSPQGLLAELIGNKIDQGDQLNDEARELWKIKKSFSAQRVLILEEAAVLFEWFGKESMKELKSIILRLYDCPEKEEESTQGRGIGIAAYNCYLSICGISTPTDLAPFLKTSTHWGNGIWARFAFVTPSWEKPPYVFYPPVMPIPEEIPGRVRRLFEKLPQPKDGRPAEAITATLAPGVWEMWDAYNKAVTYDMVYSKELSARYHSSYKRFAALAIKIALILATADYADNNSSTVQVQVGHYARAQSIAEEYRHSLHRLLETPNREGQEESLEDKAYRRIPQASTGEVITPRELSIKLNMSDQEQRFKLDNLLKQMQQDGLIQFKPSTNRRKGWCRT